MTLLHNFTRALSVLPDGARFASPETAFVGTAEEITVELNRLNLAAPKGFDAPKTPGQKQRDIFTATQAATPELLAPYLVLDSVLSALNEAGRISGNYAAAKLALEAVGTTTPEQATLKTALLACYP